MPKICYLKLNKKSSHLRLITVKKSTEVTIINVLLYFFRNFGNKISDVFIIKIYLSSLCRKVKKKRSVRII